VLTETNNNFSLFNINHYDDFIRGVDQFYKKTYVCLYIININDFNKKNIKIENKTYDHNLLEDFNITPFEVVDNILE
jgi:hypothetical protein